MKSLLTLILSLVSFNALAEGTKKIEYPQSPNLTIEVPVEWVVTDKTRFGVTSKNEELEVAGTAFSASGKKMSDFISTKRESILAKMPWYKSKGNPVKVEGTQYTAYVEEFEGIWPNEKEPTSYVVSYIEIDGLFLSLTFTSLTSKTPNYRKNIEAIYKSVVFK